MPVLPLSSDMNQESPEYILKKLKDTEPQYSLQQAAAARYRLGDMNDTVSNISDIISSTILQDQGERLSPQELKGYFPDSTLDVKHPLTIGEFTRLDKRKRELDKITRINEYSPQSAINSMMKFGAEIAGGTSTLDLAVSMGVGALAPVLFPALSKFAASSPKLYSLASNVVENTVVEPGNIVAHKRNMEEYDYLTDGAVNVVGGAVAGTGLELGVKKVIAPILSKTLNPAIEKFSETSVGKKVFKNKAVDFLNRDVRSLWQKQKLEATESIVSHSLEADKKPDLNIIDDITETKIQRFEESLPPEFEIKRTTVFDKTEIPGHRIEAPLSDGSRVMIDTRNEGVFFHGTSGFLEKLHKPENVRDMFGKGFYTTDDIRTAKNYSGLITNEGFIYSTASKRGEIPLLDFNDALPPEIISRLPSPFNEYKGHVSPQILMNQDIPDSVLHDIFSEFGYRGYNIDQNKNTWFEHHGNMKVFWYPEKDLNLKYIDETDFFEKLPPEFLPNESVISSYKTKEELVTKEQSKAFLENQESYRSDLLHDTEAEVRVETAQPVQDSKITDLESEIDEAHKIIDGYLETGYIKEADHTYMKKRLTDSKMQAKMLKQLGFCEGLV